MSKHRTRRVVAVAAGAILIALTASACNPSGTRAEGAAVRYLHPNAQITCQETAGQDPAGDVVWSAKGSCKLRFPDGDQGTVPWSSQYYAEGSRQSFVVSIYDWRCRGTGKDDRWTIDTCGVIAR